MAEADPKIGGRTIAPQPGPQTMFLSSPADIAIYGGSAGGGKSWGLLLEPVRHIENPGFGGVIFRRTTPMIRNEGGLWDESINIYTLCNGRPREQMLDWSFPSGSSLSFSHLEHDKNVLDWQGAQIPFIGFDELTHFTSKQFWYMLSRNRSTCGVRPYVRATCNPDADSWVAKLIEWWIDQDTGLPIPERAGVLRWFVRIDDALIWADSPEELHALHPDTPPKSLTFIPAKLSDNAILMASDPGYLANLMALPLVERERLLGGNWKIRPAAGLMFKREWFEIVDEVPNVRGKVSVRAWDFAATEEEESDDPDYTVGLKLTRVPDADDWQRPTFYVENVTRFRGSPEAVRSALKQTAEIDGPDTTIRGPQDPGQAGKSQAKDFVRSLSRYTTNFMRVTGSKIVRAGPASSQAEARNIKLVRGDWNEAFINELVAFPQGGHDDQVDALSDAIDELADAGGSLEHVAANPRSSIEMWQTKEMQPAQRGLMWR